MKNISRAKIFLDDDHTIKCDSVFFQGETVRCFNKYSDKTFNLNEVQKVVLYQLIPFSERRDGFLRQLIAWSYLGVLTAFAGPKSKPESIGYFALLGTGFGSLFLIRKYDINEVILNVYNNENEIKIEWLQAPPCPSDTSSSLALRNVHITK